jgi:hypothetical protein
MVSKIRFPFWTPAIPDADIARPDPVWTMSEIRTAPYIMMFKFTLR